MISLNTNDFKRMIISAANNLNSNRQLVDELNVFPVPDGDTGTNMSKTLMSAAIAVSEKSFDSVSDIANAVSSATLRGARGNSGVILSQILRGFAKGIDGDANALTLSKAFKSGAETAYRAVMKPTEGTMLTVIRMIGEAVENTDENTTVEQLFDTVIKSGNDALAKTPEMLPVLKKAGVVDSGGKGLMVIFEGMRAALSSNDEIKLTENTEQNSAVQMAFTSAEKIEFAYCTEFIIKKSSETLNGEKLRGQIQTKGDSLVLVDGGDIIKVHIHTNHPGEIIECAIKFGELVDIKIDNMKEQHQNKIAIPEEKDYAIVAVAAGDGVCTLFTDMGVDAMINGGQTMNPSADDILEKVKELPAKTVYVLPNNKNIILAAQQAAKLAPECNIRVVETRSIPQGISAVMAFDPDVDADANFEEMTERAKAVKTGMVTYAVRDSETENVSISKGDYMGIAEGRITAAGKDRTQVTKILCEDLIDDESFVVTIIYGEDATQEEAEEICGMLEEQYPDVEFTLFAGNQPVYSYMISVE